MPNVSMCTGGWRSPFSKGPAILLKLGSFCMCGSSGCNFFCLFVVFVGGGQFSCKLARYLNIYIAYTCYQSLHSAVVVLSGGAPTPAPACTSVFTKHNWDMGMGYLGLNWWGIYHLP